MTTTKRKPLAALRRRKIAQRQFNALNTEEKRALLEATFGGGRKKPAGGDR